MKQSLSMGINNLSFPLCKDAFFVIYVLNPQNLLLLRMQMEMQLEG